MPAFQLVAVQPMWLGNMVIEMSVSLLTDKFENYLEPLQWQTWVFSPSDKQLEDRAVHNVEDMFEAFVAEGVVSEQEMYDVQQTGFFVRSLMQRESCQVLHKFLAWLQLHHSEESPIVLVGPDVARLRRFIEFADTQHAPVVDLDTRAMEILHKLSTDAPTCEVPSPKEPYGTLLQGMNMVARVRDIVSFIGLGRKADPKQAHSPLWQQLQ
jgi:hypothetical protein